MKSKKLQTILKNSFLALCSIVLAASCSHNASLGTSGYAIDIPEFQANTVYAITSSGNGKSESDYYCFSSGAQGVVIAETTVNSSEEYEINTYYFKYDSSTGQMKFSRDNTQWQNWLTFMKIDNHPYYFNKDYCYKRKSGQSGLFATFEYENQSITISKSGTAKLVTSSGPLEVKCKNVNGVITIWDSSASLDFYYLEEGYLIPEKLPQRFLDSERIKLSLDLYDYKTNGDQKEENERVAAFIKSLPDNYFYELSNRSKGKKADIDTIHEILTENPNKKFSFTIYQTLAQGSSNGRINTITTGYFNKINNLYEMNLGNYASTDLSIGAGAFKDCTNLQKVYDGKFVGHYYECCFEGCTSLEEGPYISAGYQSSGKTIVEENAFKGCTNSKFNPGTDAKKIEVTKNSVTTDITSEVSSSGLGTLLTGKYVDYEWTFYKYSY